MNHVDSNLDRSQSPEMITSLNWRADAFEDLGCGSLYSILAARIAVFVVEQNCPYQDADGLDADSLHVQASDAQGRLWAYARVTPPGSRFKEPSIGRVLTTSRARGCGLGHELMRWTLSEIHRRHGAVAIRISAQRHLEAFYQAHGFTTTSAPYDEDGIEHVEMLRPPAPEIASEQ
ncbi:MAG: GNAT family N-acetyltransferase [Wenzhouxiangellaceae bacterium]|nr:GNAT family N-acetyltransferase [Wenzhouxiangellaceae bacterium]